MSARKAADLKVLQGTGRADRIPHRSPLDRLGTVPEVPPHLDGEARKEWASIAGACIALGTLLATDLRALELLVSVLATERELRRRVASEDADEARKTYRLLESVRNQAARLLDSFGLTPRGREGVSLYPTTGTRSGPEIRQPASKLAKYLK